MKMFIFDSMANQRSAGALLKSLCRLFGYLSFISFFSAFFTRYFQDICNWLSCNRCETKSVASDE